MKREPSQAYMAVAKEEEDAGSSASATTEITDVDDVEYQRRYWDSYPQPNYENRVLDLIWDRLSALPLCRLMPTRKINPRYFIFAFTASILLSLLLFNPYTPKAFASHKSDLDVHSSPTSSYDNGPSSTKPSKPHITHHKGPGPYERPAPLTNSTHCTTWPVDEYGNFDVKPSLRQKKADLTRLTPEGGWKKPKGIKIIGMVFFGRKRFVDILDCYLRQNLASNGGFFDEVWFMVNTQDEDDIDWVEDLAENVADYKVKGLPASCKGKPYKCMWKYAVESKTMYIKIDDDIVFIHPDAIPQLVHTRINQPHPFAVSANLVNSPVTGMEHYHFGAIHPFMPDPRKKPRHKAAVSWRPSEKEEFPAMVDGKRSFSNVNYDILKMKAPYRGHPWLLLSNDSSDLLFTPLGKYDQKPGSDEIAFGAAWKSWGIAVQQQYSLFQNLETNEMDRYFFGRRIQYRNNSTLLNNTSIIPPIPNTPGGEQTYDTGYKRYNLNFVAVWGIDIRRQLPIADDDEQDITSDIPKRVKRPFLIDTRAVVGHYSFFTQQEGVVKTDLLDRYRAYANENVCTPKNLKVPWDFLCPSFDENFLSSNRTLLNGTSIRNGTTTTSRNGTRLSH